MRGLLPIVEQLGGYDDLEQRREWLMRVPDGVINREHMSIRVILQRSGFIEGVKYLDARLSATNATRCKDGSMPATIALAVHIAANDMVIAARKARVA